MAVLLVPGFMLDADLWSDIARDLEPFGPVTHADPAHAESIEQMAAQALAAAPARFTLIGFSMGGYVARAIQRRAPERVSGLVLIATSARPDGGLQEQRRGVLAGVTPDRFRGVSKASIRQALSPASEGDAALVERIHAMSLRLGGEVFRRQALFQRHGDLERLADIACPTLIVAGAHDRLRTAEEAAEMALAIPGARMEIVEAGHMIPMEAPAQLSRILRSFLSA
ncbi:MAG: alpha/beta hydrolase [Paracoccus sp. (in: a-proteobacteria)]|uniref:alpha/beta fold hydrolase n=1 Tax=Paracoccus sp. TaxID=267 RepID=UPI0039E5754F